MNWYEGDICEVHDSPDECDESCEMDEYDESDEEYETDKWAPYVLNGQIY